MRFRQQARPRLARAEATAGAPTVVWLPILRGAAGAQQLRAACALLAPVERHHVGTLQRAGHDARALAYALSRALRRRLLRAALGQLATSWPIVGRTGHAPTLAWPYAALATSLSHAPDAVACAFAPAGRLGVDVETTARPGFAAARAERVAARFCSPDEARWLAAVAPAARPLAFVALWTAKEAVLKACGTGLRLPPRSFTVQLPPWPGPGAARPLRATVRWHAAPPAGVHAVSVRTWWLTPAGQAARALSVAAAPSPLLSPRPAWRAALPATPQAIDAVCLALR